MTPSDTLRPQMDRVQRSALFVGLVALADQLDRAVHGSRAFLAILSVRLSFSGGLALGCLGIFFLHNVVGGNWGVAIRRLVESGLKLCR